MKNRHFTMSERIFIESSLGMGRKIHEIALTLKCADSSVIREIMRNRYKYITKRNEHYKCLKTNTCEMHHGCGDEECNRLCRNCLEICDTEKCAELI